MEASLEEMRRGLELRPHEIDISRLLPIFVRSSNFASGNWLGPGVRLQTPDIALTWTVLLGQTMRYVSFEMVDYWESQEVDWKDLSMRNLAAVTAHRDGIHAMKRSDGSLSALVFLFEDGLGPSRLLFRATLAEQFPHGYRVAIPEMSCGVAFAKDLNGPELENLQNMIAHCHRNSARPLAPGVYEPDELLPRMDWSL